MYVIVGEFQTQLFYFFAKQHKNISVFFFIFDGCAAASIISLMVVVIEKGLQVK